MGKYASGKFALAISDRSGQAFPYKDMRKEWNGSLVSKAEYEPKQPQLGPFRKVFDAEALRDARPDRTEPFVVFVGVPVPENMAPKPVRAFGIVGEVTVSTP
jgi:hypothetical protein